MNSATGAPSFLYCRSASLGLPCSILLSHGENVPEAETTPKPAEPRAGDGESEGLARIPGYNHMSKSCRGLSTSASQQGCFE